MAHLTRTQIRDLLDRHGLAPSRALGQNFLCDPAMVDKIVRLSGVGPGDRVVEIGPGLGSLTLGLADAGASVLAVEIDRHLIAPLSEVVVGTAVDIRHADAMTLDWDAELGDESWTVVANLPYNVATPLILDLLVAQPQMRRWVVMVQREVGERLAAPPGDRACGIPSAIVSYWAEAKIVGRVPSQLFLPQPKVESVLVRIDRSPTPRIDCDYRWFESLVRTAFGQRRKMLRRSLAGIVDPDQMVEAGIDPTARPEALDLESWGRLARLPRGGS